MKSNIMSKTPRNKELNSSKSLTTEVSYSLFGINFKNCLEQRKRGKN